MRRTGAIGFLILFLLVLLLGARCGRFLVVDERKKSDVILVLAGETDRRPARALELLDAGYGRRLILDVPAEARIYQWTQPEIAQKYIEALPQAEHIAICPTYGLSTKAEARDTERCLARAGARSVLLVTSDYHTRRALSTFRQEVPGYQFSVAAAYDPREFGSAWWQHRQWAKVNFDEWLRLLWWEAVDRWL